MPEFGIGSHFSGSGDTNVLDRSLSQSGTESTLLMIRQPSLVFCSVKRSEDVLPRASVMSMRATAAALITSTSVIELFRGGVSDGMRETRSHHSSCVMYRTTPAAVTELSKAVGWKASGIAVLSRASVTRR